MNKLIIDGGFVYTDASLMEDSIINCITGTPSCIVGCCTRIPHQLSAVTISSSDTNKLTVLPRTPQTCTEYATAFVFGDFATTKEWWDYIGGYGIVTGKHAAMYVGMKTWMAGGFCTINQDFHTPGTNSVFDPRLDADSVIEQLKIAYSLGLNKLMSEIMSGINQNIKEYVSKRIQADMTMIAGEAHKNDRIIVSSLPEYLFRIPTK